LIVLNYYYFYFKEGIYNMLDMEKMAKGGFKIIDGRLCDNIGCWIGNIRVEEFGWGSPCTEYHFSDYELHEYSIEKSVYYDEWYLKKTIIRKSAG
jgi:hypothetical protein